MSPPSPAPVAAQLTEQTVAPVAGALDTAPAGQLVSNVPPPDPRLRVLHLVQLRNGTVHYAQLRPGTYGDDVYMTLCKRIAGGTPAWGVITPLALDCATCRKRADKAEQNSSADKTSTKS